MTPAPLGVLLSLLSSGDSSGGGVLLALLSVCFPRARLSGRVVLKDTLAKWTLGLCCPEPVEGSVDDWRGRGGLYYSHSLLGN